VFTKDQFLASCAHEIRVIKHLATKIPEGSLDWRPSPSQRSTLELLRYLATCAVVPAIAMVRGSWEHAEAAEKEAETVLPSTFAQAMDLQEKRLREVVEAVPEDDLATRPAVLPWGEPNVLGQALVNTVLKALTAYRMQLFLHAKASGNPALGPADCWVGVEAEKAS
jgi:hypothetical protein